MAENKLGAIDCPSISLPGTGRQSNAFEGAHTERSKLGIGSRYWIGCAIIVYSCLVSMIAELQYERRSAVLTNQLQEVVEFLATSDDVVSDVVQLAGSLPDERLLYLISVRTNLHFKEQLAYSLLENLSSFGESKVAGLAGTVSDFIDEGKSLISRIAEEEAIRPQLLTNFSHNADGLQSRIKMLSMELFQRKENLSFTRNWARYGTTTLIILSILASIFLVRRSLETTVANSKAALVVRGREFDEKIGAAEAANVAKNSFLKRIGDEIRAPIASIMSMLEQLKRTNLSQSQRECTGIIESSGTRLLKVMDDVHCFSEISSGELHVAKKRCALEDIIADIREKCESYSIGKLVDYRVTAQEELPGNITCDRKRILQIVTILIDNAFRFAEDGDVEVRIWQKAGRTNAGDSATIVFSVKDNGFGIPQARQEQLRKSMVSQRAPFESDRNLRGLGLEMASRLANAMDGSLDFISTEGQGSVFSFAVKVSKAADFLEESELRPANSNPGVHQILLVTTDEEVSATVARFLDEQKFEFTTTKSISEASAVLSLANRQGLNAQAVLLDRDILDPVGPAISVAELRSGLPSSSMVVGLGEWSGWSSAGVFRYCRMSALSEFLEQAIEEKREANGSNKDGDFNRRSWSA